MFRGKCRTEEKRKNREDRLNDWLDRATLLAATLLFSSLPLHLPLLILFSSLPPKSPLLSSLSLTNSHSPPIFHLPSLNPCLPSSFLLFLPTLLSSPLYPSLTTIHLLCSIFYLRMGYLSKYMFCILCN